MGPRFLQRGNGFFFRLSRQFSKKLQWGHAFYSVEISVQNGKPLAFFVASMGPRFLQRGNRQIHANLKSTLEASMGPRFLQRGNVCPDSVKSRKWLSFNGATLFTAWK